MSQPEESQAKTPKTEPLLPRPPDPRHEQRRNAVDHPSPHEPDRVVEVHGIDVRRGPEETEIPQAGTTEPPD